MFSKYNAINRRYKMKRFMFQLVYFSIPILLTIAGCGGGSGAPGGAGESSKGSVALSVDLQTLATKSAAKTLLAAPSPTFTSATVELSRDGYPGISQNMTIVSNVASCRIDNLDQGYWHVVVHIFNDTTEIYTGSSDANVLPGAVAQLNILFDPVVVTPTTGSIAISAAINPMPGYSVINQQITKTLLDPVGGKLYIYDATTKTVGVYTADTMVRTRDITLAAAPAAVAFTATKDAMLLGYSSGQIYRLDLATGTTTLVGDALMDVKGILAMDNRIALVNSQSGSQTTFKTFDLTTGQILNTKSYYYYFGDCLLNPANGLVYAQDVYVSPVDLFRIKVDLTTGVVSEIADSPYHGDYYLGEPLRLIKGGSRLVTAAGTIFTSSTIAGQDLLYSGNLGFSYIDLAVDDATNRLYLLNNGSPYKMLILNQDSYFVNTTVDLLGTPKHVFATPAKIIAVTSQNSVNYAKVFDKAALGL
jgi:hypothetical protein